MRPQSVPACIMHPFIHLDARTVISVLSAQIERIFEMEQNKQIRIPKEGKKIEKEPSPAEQFYSLLLLTFIP